MENCLRADPVSNEEAVSKSTAMEKIKRSFEINMRNNSIQFLMVVIIIITVMKSTCINMIQTQNSSGSVCALRTQGCVVFMCVDFENH